MKSPTNRMIDMSVKMELKKRRRGGVCCGCTYGDQDQHDMYCNSDFDSYSDFARNTLKQKDDMIMELYAEVQAQSCDCYPIVVNKRASSVKCSRCIALEACDKIAESILK